MKSEASKLVAFLCENPATNLTVWCGQVLAPYGNPQKVVAEFHSHAAALTALRVAREEIAKHTQSKGEAIETHMAIYHPNAV